LIRNLRHYYNTDLKKDADFDTLDQAAIAKQGDVAHIAHLVELVAAACVTCEQKSEYISRIMGMSPEGQVEMKGVLERSLARLSDLDDEDADESGYDDMEDDGEMVFDDADKKEGAGGDASLFGADHLANEGIQQELEALKRELSQYKAQAAAAAEDSAKSQQTLKAVVDDLQDRLVRRQDELIAVEEDLQNVRSELDDTKSKLNAMEQEKAQLADDLDVANAKAQQLHKAEATVVAYKKKLEGAGMVNQQMTELEDQAAGYLRQIMDLENQVKKSNALQKSVTSLQEDIAKLEKEKNQLEASNQSHVTEIDNLKSQLAGSERSKKMFESELNELRAQMETLKENEVAASVPPQLPGSNDKEQTEKMLRLQAENQKLQEEVEKLQKGVAGLSVANAVSPAKDTASEAEVAELKSEVDKLQQELEAKQKENAKISSDKDKLEAYTKRTLAKFQDKYLVALQECKAKLKEKQDKIEVLENRSASERTAQKREERLLSSTIYELGMAIMQNRLKER